MTKLLQTFSRVSPTTILADHYKIFSFILIGYNNITILFISTWHHNITLFLVCCLKEGRWELLKNAVVSLVVGSNPGPLAPELCVLPCAPLHIHWIVKNFVFSKKWKPFIVITFVQRETNNINRMTTLSKLPFLDLRQF